jgi:hypothetical protein
MRRRTPSYWDSQLTLGLWSGPESPPDFHPIALSSQHISEIPGVFTDPDHRKQKSKIPGCPVSKGYWVH